MNEVFSQQPVVDFNAPEYTRSGRFLRLDPSVDLGASGYDEFIAAFQTTTTTEPPPIYVTVPPPVTTSTTRPPRPPHRTTTTTTTR
jgi:hypothetical protein